MPGSQAILAYLGATGSLQSKGNTQRLDDSVNQSVEIQLGRSGRSNGGAGT
jgi:hypothetical protein